jgi:hypothetical protein
MQYMYHEILYKMFVAFLYNRLVTEIYSTSFNTDKSSRHLQSFSAGFTWF